MLVPLLELRTLDGSPAPWKAIWQRKNLLLLVAHGDCAECPQVLERWLAHLHEHDAEVVVVYAEPPATPPEGAIALLDPEGRMADALGVPPGTAVAADRYFAIKAILPVHELGPEAVSDDALDWIDLAESTCDECGVPVW